MIALLKPQPTSTVQTIRPYQEDAITAILTSWAQGKTPLVAAATGLGKSVIMAELAVRTLDPRSQRAIVIAHTEEIIFQLFAEVKNQFGTSLDDYYGATFAPGIGIVMAANDDKSARIVIATRQSLHPKRLAEVLEFGQVDYLFIDEAHHVSADNTYWQITETLRASNPDLKIAGFTATPKRTDKKALGVLFNDIAYNATILDGIRWGYLVPPVRLIQKTQVDASNIKTVEGDYDKGMLVDVLSAANWVDLAVKAYQDKIQPTNRLALAFFPQVQMSELFIHELQIAGVPAAHLDGKTPKDQRRAILRDFKQHKLKVVSNFTVLTEGFNAPEAAAILWARPTRSETVLTQALGRGLRIFPGKTDCLFVDLTVADTKALQVGTLLGKMKTCKNPECNASFFAGFKHCPVCGLEVTAEKKEDDLQETDPLHIQIAGRGFGDSGEGIDLVDEIGSLFSGLYTAWYHEGELYSTSAGFDNGCFVILPPSYGDNEDRIRERLHKGTELLPNISNEKRPILLDQMARLQRELARIEQYTLWYVPDELNERGYKQPGIPEYTRANSDLTALLQEAEFEAIKQASGESKNGKKQTDKNASWRYQLVSPGQINFLARLGKTDLPHDLTKGSAAQMITHIQGTKAVQSFIERDALPERTN